MPIPLCKQGFRGTFLDDRGAEDLTPVSYVLEDEREKAAMGVRWGGDCLS